MVVYVVCFSGCLGGVDVGSTRSLWSLLLGCLGRQHGVTVLSFHFSTHVTATYGLNCFVGWSQNDQSKVGIGHGTAVAGYGVANIKNGVAKRGCVVCGVLLLKP